MGLKKDTEKKLHKEEKEAQENVLEIIFPPYKDSRRPYFDIKKFVEEDMPYEEDAEYAYELLRTKSARITNLDIAYISDYSSYKGYLAMEVYAAVGDFSSFDDKPSESTLFMSISKDKLRDVSCVLCNTGRRINYYFDEKPRLCRHALAALSLVDRYVRIHDPGDNTDSEGNLFLNAFRRKDTVGSKNEKKYGSVVLKPRIVRETGGGLELCFKIGNTGKLYSVKNITTLYDTVSTGGSFSLGKTGQIDFKAERFDEPSAKLFELIKENVKNLEAIDKKLSSRRRSFGYYYRPPSVEAKKSLSFQGAVADRIYKEFYGEKIECSNIYEGAPKEFLVGTGIPELGVNINSRGKAADITVSGTLPVIAEGVNKKYFFENGIFGEIEEADWKLIQPFYDISDFKDSFKFEIGNKMSSEFYYRVLPELRESHVFKINEDAAIETLINPEVVFTFYLDYEDYVISCRAIASYGDKSYTLCDFRNVPPMRDSSRDIFKEDEVITLLETIFEAYAANIESFVLLCDDDDMYTFLTVAIPLLLKEGEVNTTEAFSGLNVKKSFPVQIGVSVKSDIMNLELLSEDFEGEELLSVLDSYKKKKKYHKLKNGQFIDLEGNEELAAFSEMFESLGIKSKDIEKGNLQLPSYRALYLDSLLESHEELVADRDKIFRNLIRNFKTVNDSEFEIPTELKGVLRSYQEYGFKWLKTLEVSGFGGILADDMGLGKTIQVIALLKAYKSDTGKVNALIVCPASLVYNWLEEIKRFAPDMSVALVVGGKAQRRLVIEAYEDTDILVTSYDLLKRDVELYEAVQFSHQILDEAQFIKNAGAQAAKSVKLISARHRFALTGTPIENRLSELWSIFDYLMPGFLFGYDEFRKRFEKPISKDDDEAALETLKKFVSPFLLRRKKEEVLKDLPEKTQELCYCAFEDKQRHLYDAQVMQMKQFIASEGSDFNKSKIQILAYLTKIRQICCDPLLLFENYDGESAKLDMCIELVKSAHEGGHKMLLFSQFTSMLELIEKELAKEGLSYYKITGATPKEERLRLVKSFNTDDTPVFLISLKAGGTGLNLTGADIVIHYDPWWNTAAQDQATDRAHRIGQTRKVTVYKLIAKGTIEEKIVKLQETKQKLADSVLSGEAASIASMSKEELLEILS